MKKVLIVSYHFPPLNTMAAKRYGFMCKYFEENGYQPYILTVRPRGGGYLNVKLDLKVPVEKKQILKVGDLGIRYPIYNPIINILLYEYRIKRTASRIIEDESFGWYEKVKRELNLKQLPDVDIVLGTFPSIGNLLVARYIAKKLNRPFIAEIRDLISDYEEGYNRNETGKKIELFMEKIIMSSAAGIVTVTEGFKNILIARYRKKKVVAVYNGWDGEPLPINADKAEDYLYYAGTLYEHRVESLRILFEAIKKYNMKERVIIRSLGPQYLDDKLKGYVSQMKLEEQVKILKAATEEVVCKEQAHAKINLLVSSTDEKDAALMTTLPGKLFELIRLNQPILAIVNENAEVAQILNKTNKGVAASNPESVRNFINSDLEEYKGYHESVEEFSRKNQTKKLCEYFDQIVR